jgi:UDP:flavonoid glycosyltransferase YjiC (YdhE family)
MRFVLLPLGSAGDVLPFCALGRVLQRRGHDVLVAANPHSRALVDEAGLAYEPLGDEEEYRRLVGSSHFMSRALGFPRLMRWVAAQVGPTYRMAAAHRGATVLAHPLAFGARVAEARHGVRTATLLLSPAILQSAHEPPVTPGLPNSPLAPGWYKRSMWWALDRLILDPLIAPSLNELRRCVGVPRLQRVFRDGWYSEHLFVALFPDWFAPRQPDWPRRLVYAGFPLYDGNGESLETELVFTPGTGHRRARAFFDAAVVAARGRDALLLTPFADQLPPLPKNVRHLPYAPLSRLRYGALVHHGGIGTAAAALAAGAPQLVMPFAHDQPDNAARLRRLGVAHELRRLRDMPEALDALIRSASVEVACRAAAARIAGTRSLQIAADAVENEAAEAAA